MRPLAPLLLLLALAAALCRAQAPSFAIGFSSDPVFNSVQATSGLTLPYYAGALPSSCVPGGLAVQGGPPPVLYLCDNATAWQPQLYSVVGSDSSLVFGAPSAGVVNVRLDYYQSFINLTVTNFKTGSLVDSATGVDVLQPIAYDYYLSLAGSDSGTGSSISPWLTIAHALTVLSPTLAAANRTPEIHLSSGVWSESFDPTGFIWKGEGPRLTFLSGNLTAFSNSSVVFYGVSFRNAQTWEVPQFTIASITWTLELVDFQSTLSLTSASTTTVLGVVVRYCTFASTVSVTDVAFPQANSAFNLFNAAFSHTSTVAAIQLGFFGSTFGSTVTLTASGSGSILPKITGATFSSLPATSGTVTFSLASFVPTTFTAGTDVSARHFISTSGAPTCAAGAGVGSTGSCAISTSPTDMGFQSTVTVSGVPATGNIGVFTFATTFPNSAYTVFSPCNVLTAALSGTTATYISAQSSSSFTFHSGTVALPVGTYCWNFNQRGN